MENMLFLKVQFLGYDFTQMLDHFREYLGVSRENLDENFVNHNSEVKKDMERLKPDEMDELFYWSDQEVKKLTQVFPSILNQSHFLASFSLFESLIVTLCEVVRSELGVEEKLLKTNRVNHALSLIRRYGKIDFTILRPKLVEIELYRGIRDQLAHFGGHLDSSVKKDETLRAKLTDERLFKIENNRIEVQDYGNYKSLTAYETILKGLIEQIIINHRPVDYKEPF